MSGRVLFVLLASILWTGVAAGQSSPQVREWSDASGMFKVRATLVRVEADKVVLEKENGVEISVALDLLNKADRDYVAALERAKTEAPQASAKPDTRTPPIVFIKYRGEGRNWLLAGIVYRSHEGKSYVIADASYHADFRSKGEAIPSASTTCTAVWKVGQKEHKADVKAISAREFAREWIFVGSADELPVAWDSREKPKVVEKQNVQIVNYDIDYAQESYRSRTLSATVIGPGPPGKDGEKIDRFEVRLKNPDLKDPQQKFNIGAVLNAQGETAGIVTAMLKESSPPGAKNLYVVRELPEYSWEKPRLRATQVFPLSGDRHKTEWRMVTLMVDPMQQTKNLPVVVQPAYGYPHNDPVYERTIASPVGPLSEQPGVVNLTLKSEPLPDLWVKGLRPTTGEIIFWGDFTAANFGWEESKRFAYELKGVGNRGGGSASTFFTWYQPTKQTEELVQALSGHSLGTLAAPVAKEIRNKVYQITSDATRIEPPLLAIAPVNPPRPTSQVVSLAGEKKTDAEVATCKLNVKLSLPSAEKNYKRQYSLLATSPDAKYFFLIDADNVLHKVEWDTLQSITSLRLPGKAGALQQSQAGLLVVLNGKSLWQIDPQSLEVTRQYYVPGIVELAASPGGKIAVGYGYTSGSSHYLVIDLERGQVVHRVRSRPEQNEQFVLPVEFGEEKLRPFPGEGEDHYHMTDDGKYFVVQSDSRLDFRIEGTDLILEQYRGYRGVQRVKGSFARKGTRFVVAHLDYAKPKQGEGIGLVDFENSKDFKSIVIGDKIQSIGVDPVGDKYYVAKDQQLLVVHTSGRILASTKLPASTHIYSPHGENTLMGFHCQLLDPGGNRLLLADATDCWLLDLQPGRLKK